MVGSYWYSVANVNLHPLVGKNRTEQRSFVVAFDGTFMDFRNDYNARTYSFPVSELTFFESAGNRADLKRVYLAGLKIAAQKNSFAIPMCITIDGLPTSTPNSTIVIPAASEEKGCTLVNLPLKPKDTPPENFSFMDLNFVLQRFDDLEWGEPPKKGTVKDTGTVSIQIDILYRNVQVFEK